MIIHFKADNNARYAYMVIYDEEKSLPFTGKLYSKNQKNCEFHLLTATQLQCIEELKKNLLDDEIKILEVEEIVSHSPTPEVEMAILNLVNY